MHSQGILCHLEWRRGCRELRLYDKIIVNNCHCFHFVLVLDSWSLTVGGVEHIPERLMMMMIFMKY